MIGGKYYYRPLLAYI